MGGYYDQGIQKGVNLENISDGHLIAYHDQLHIIWKKLEDGYPIQWSFLEIYTKHMQTVMEIGIRELPHLVPINDLDMVIAS